MTAHSVIFGFHAVSSRIRRHPESVQELYLASGRHDRRALELLRLAEAHAVCVVLVDSNRLQGLAGSDKHQGAVAKVAPLPRHRHLDEVLESLREPPLLLVLDGVQDPHNLGACLRVADAFGVHAVIAPKDRAVGLTETVSKVACGAAETVPYLPVTNLARSLRDLKERGLWVVGTAAEAGQDLFSAQLDGPLAWVLGAEGTGMRRLTRELCDFLVGIPMFGTVESLNVSVSAGICVYETRRQRAVKAGDG
jgi:23S rRNA (guanosine2251-2'-O)-methyltransferase